MAHTAPLYHPLINEAGRIHEKTWHLPLYGGTGDDNLTEDTLYAKLISIGNNVWMASGVEFIPHDVTHFMLNGMKDGHKYQEKIGCIEIGNNVFIGADAKILYDVKVGDNVIIAAGALVNKDVPSDTVWGGYREGSSVLSKNISKDGDSLLWSILRIIPIRLSQRNVKKKCGQLSTAAA